MKGENGILGTIECVDNNFGKRRVVERKAWVLALVALIPKFSGSLMAQLCISAERGNCHVSKVHGNECHEKKSSVEVSKFMFGVIFFLQGIDVTVVWCGYRFLCEN